MSRRLQETISEEKGQSLIWALITLTVAAVVIIPFLLFLNSNVLISGKRHTKVWEIYATDSGVEYAIYQIQNYSQTLGVDEIGATAVVTLSVNGVPLRVNEEIITATIQNSTPAGPAYILWANTNDGGCSPALKWTGGAATAVGDIHSNLDIEIQAGTGSNKTITGTVEYVTGISYPEDKVTFEPPPPDNPVTSTVQSWPVTYNIEDYAPGGWIAQAVISGGGYYTSATSLPSPLVDGLYFITSTSDINLNLSSDITITLVVTGGGGIKIPGSNVIYRSYTDAYVQDDLLFFTNQYVGNPQCGSNKKVIHVTGSGNTFMGTFYGPYGHLDFSAQDGSRFRAFGNSVSFQASGIGAGGSTYINRASLLGEGCFYYDIVSESGGTETRARVLMCNDQPTVLSWLVD